MRWTVLAALAIVGYQLFVPPIIGLADQGDFRRVVGKFGYGPQPPATPYTFVTEKYVRDPTYRLPDWERISSEDLLAGTAALAKSIISKDEALDIRIIGLVHTLAFLSAFMWLLYQTRDCRARGWIWIAALLVTTDAGYVAYFNSFYAEPASYIFCILLIAESAGICIRGTSAARLARWSLFALLLVFAKPANAPIGFLLAVYAIRLSWRSKVAWAGAAAILTTSVLTLVTAPSPMMDVNTYNMVFLAVLPEAKNPAADASALGLPPGSEALSGTGAWSTNSGYSQLRSSGVIGKRVTSMTVLQFDLARPSRMWRHIRSDLRIATSLRPPLGNFVQSSGYPPYSMSRAFSIWSDIHQHVLAPAARSLIFLLLPIPAVVAATRRLRSRESRFNEEFFALLGLCCMLAFLIASFGDAWETIKHMFLFNVLLDTWLLCAGAYFFSAPAVAGVISFSSKANTGEEPDGLDQRTQK